MTVQLFLSADAKLLNCRLKLVQVCLILSLVLNLFLNTLQDPHSGSIVIDLPSSLKSSVDNFSRRDKVVGKGVVETSLKLEKVRDRLEEGLVSSVERLVRLGLIAVSTPGSEADSGKSDRAERSRNDGSGPKKSSGDGRKHFVCRLRVEWGAGD